MLFFCPFSLCPATSLLRKWAGLYLLLFVYFQILTSVLAVLMTVTVHVLYVQTQWDPLIVHVTVLTLEMAELAIYHQVIRKR